MTHTTSSRNIDAPADAVWDVLVDVEQLPSISPSTVSVRSSGKLARVGDSFDQTVRLAGRRFTSSWSVTRFEPGTAITVTGSILPGVRYCITEDVAPIDDDRSTLTVSVEYSLPLGVLGRLAGRLGAERKALAESKVVIDGIARLTEDRTRTKRSDRTA